MKILRNDCFIRTNFLPMISISLFILFPNNVDLYDYMVDWEKFRETSLPGKEYFYCLVNMEDITDADYMHGNRVCKGFNINRLGDVF